METLNDPGIEKAVESVKERFEQKLEAIKEKGNSKIQEVQEDSPDPNAVEATVDITFDVKFKDTSIKFDIPRFSTALHKIIFDMPQVTMKTKSISWDVPATKMERRCIAKKPVFKCSGLKCTTKMECIYMDMPVAYMKRMEIKTDVPEFVMKPQDISFDKPVITMETVEIILKLPQFHLRDLSADLKEQEGEFQDIGREMEAEVAVAKREMDEALLTEVGSEVEKVFDGIRQQLIEERGKVSVQFDDAIAKMKTAIKTLKENNAVDEVAALEKQLGELVTNYTDVLKDIDNGIEELNREQKRVMEEIKFS